MEKEFLTTEDLTIFRRAFLRDFAFLLPYFSQRLILVEEYYSIKQCNVPQIVIIMSSPVVDQSKGAVEDSVCTSNDGDHQPTHGGMVDRRQSTVDYSTSGNVENMEQTGGTMVDQNKATVEQVGGFFKQPC